MRSLNIEEDEGMISNETKERCGSKKRGLVDRKSYEFEL